MENAVDSKSWISHSNVRAYFPVIGCILEQNPLQLVQMAVMVRNSEVMGSNEFTVVARDLNLGLRTHRQVLNHNSTRQADPAPSSFRKYLSSVVDHSCIACSQSESCPPKHMSRRDFDTQFPDEIIALPQTASVVSSAEWSLENPESNALDCCDLSLSEWYHSLHHHLVKGFSLHHRSS